MKFDFKAQLAMKLSSTQKYLRFFGSTVWVHCLFLCSGMLGYGEEVTVTFALSRRLRCTTGQKKMPKRDKSQQTRSGLLSHPSFTDKKKGTTKVQMDFFIIEELTENAIFMWPLLCRIVSIIWTIFQHICGPRFPKMEN